MFLFFFFLGGFWVLKFYGADVHHVFVFLDLLDIVVPGLVAVSVINMCIFVAFLEEKWKSHLYKLSMKKVYSFITSSQL